MAHNLEIVNGEAMMAYRETAGRPWHHLGTPVGDDLTPAEMMKAAGLDWEVESVPTFVDIKGNQIPTGTNALIRTSDQSVLSPMIGEDWKPVQNAEAFEFFSEFVSSGDMMMDTAGSLKDGQIVWALADVKDGFKLFGGDEVRGYLLFSNPHIYGKSIDIKFVLERVVCNNTLTMALAEKGQPSVKVNHRREFNAEEVKQVLGLGHQRLEQFEEAATLLGSKRYTDYDFERFLGKVFGESNKEGKKLSRTGERALEIVETQPGAEFRPGTWWNAYNAVTYLTDHELGRSADTRMTSAWFGSNAKKKVDALNLALDFAEAA
jgi:phage/plasmid-like protein (TIGR03299 family)